MAETATTLHALIQAGADEATALSSPGGVPLTFGALRALTENTVASLNAQGIGRGDRVAIVLDNGPEMAAAFIAIAAGTTSAPLNPAYKADEFEFYLTDLNAKLLVAAEGSQSPAVAVAEKLGVPVVRLTPTPEQGAGSFTLAFPAGTVTPAANSGPAHPRRYRPRAPHVGHHVAPEDRPAETVERLRLGPQHPHHPRFTAEDRGLNIMPLFHIHGLIAGILAPLSAGGQVCCTPGFNALKFFGWMSEVPPDLVHGGADDAPGDPRSRGSQQGNHRGQPAALIRSSSSSMPPQVMKEIEDVFGAPLLEAYGMTEAAHQMASNPLPPRPHYAGSVGIAAGPEIAIVDEDGEPLPAGETGEIVIRGDNVMAGYENNEKAMPTPSPSRAGSAPATRAPSRRRDISRSPGA